MRKTFVWGLLLAAVASAQVVEEVWVYKGNPKWERSWNDRPAPRAGACFFKDPNFKGDRFCVVRGERLPSLPGNFGGKISSIELFGPTSVLIFNDRNYSGGTRPVERSIYDLHNLPFRDGHTWNDRISSVIIR
jgi:hypothetical protein